MISLTEILFLIIALAVIHLISSMYLLYQTLFWIDLLLHFISGVLFSLVWFWWASRRIKLSDLKKIPTFIPFISVLGFALLGGVAWEIIEYGRWRLFPDLGNFSQNYVPSVSDTLSDLVFDMLGALVTVLIASFFPQHMFDNKKKSDN